MQSDVLEQIRRLAAEAEAETFYGTLSFGFRAGRLVLIRREETWMPKDDGLAQPRLYQKQPDQPKE